MKKKLFLLLMAILATIPNLKATDIYLKLVGNFNDWDNQKEKKIEIKISEGQTGTFKNVPIGTSEFKLRRWQDSYGEDDWIGGPSTLTVANEVTLTQGGGSNMSISGAASDDKYDLQVSISSDGKTIKLKALHASNGYTVFIDASGVKWADARIHYWGCNYATGNFNEAVKLRSVNSSNSYLYEYWFAEQPEGFMIINGLGSGDANQTANINYINDGDYYYINPGSGSGKKSVSKQSSTLAAPTYGGAVGNYLYFNAGGDYYKWLYDNNVTSYNLYAYFWTDYTKEPTTLTTGTPMQLYSTGDMTQIYRVAVPSNAKAVTVVAQTANGAYVKNTVNPAGSSKGKYVYKSELGQDRRRYNWAKYIFGPGNNEQMHQSYCTITDLENALKRKGEDGIFYQGQGMTVYTTNSTKSKLLNWNNGADYECTAIDEKDDDGIYITKISVTTGTEFKVSFLNPAKYDNFPRNENGNWVNNGNSNAWWATFNLGIIGPSENIYTASSTTSRIEGTPGAANAKVKYAVNNTIKYNHYNQYNWKLEGASNGTYYLVFDTYEGTACMLDFDPVPSLTVNKKGDESLQRIETGGYVATDHPGGYENKDEAVNYYLANQLAAIVNLYPADMRDNTKFQNNYTFDYSLMTNVSADPNVRELKELALFEKSTSTDSYEIEMTSMPVGEDVLYVRAIYTDQDNTDRQGGTNLRFRSRVHDATIAADMPKLSALSPQTAEVKKLLHNTHYDASSKEYYDEDKLDAIIGIPYHFPASHPFSTSSSEADDQDGSAAVYPAFKVWVDGNEEKIGYVIPSDYQYLKVDPNAKSFLLNGYSWGGDDQTLSSVVGTEDYSWVTKSAMSCNKTSDVDNLREGFLPIYVPNAMTTADLNKGLTIKVTLYAYYPFHVNKTELNVTKNSGRGAKENIRKARRALGENSDIIPIPVPTQTFTVNYPAGLGGLSGIVDIRDFQESHGEDELYNLQGVRVLDANPAAGVYIRRAADGTATKVYVR